MFDELFGKLDDTAWLQAMLDAEKALVSALAQAGHIPVETAEEIKRHCTIDGIDPAELGRRAIAAGNPVVPLVKLLRERVPEHARYVHFGATSQDIMDTAAALVASRALVPMTADVDAAMHKCLLLAGDHRDTVMIGRTLGQQASPVTFGLKCAGWATALYRAVHNVRRVRLDAQLGGAVGTLAMIGDTKVSEWFAVKVGLTEPVIPWHTDRTRLAELAAALGVLAGVLGKIALDVTLLAQTEIDEVREATGGGSSTLPHKQNPTRSVLITAAVRQVPGLVATMLAAMPQENERATGAWHAEWETLTSLLRLVGGAAARTRDLLDGLQVDKERMRVNLELTNGLVMAEAVVARTGQPEVVAEIVRRAAESGQSFRACLIADRRINLSEEDIDRALDPAEYVGVANEFVERVLRYRYE
ncbi:class-II fumarase/aspartase family protein [Actinocrispum wychmicini]|uniref:3-carboxy-cis,cis-muconate cycloisomerase n=1 Tax=Actinocrispum wychmicini TaxID=1213861 RepID=A0A4R2IRI2_9PSEU|nr:adenylosuccinate lyase family protein [Actinocrispum wychmicini]TCO46668.1 3-carboxy-cis,cis-muconate cycloisomerase [Actinocrispum wychmicini]